MGGSKQILQECLERGFGDVPDKMVCVDCIGEPALRTYIQNHSQYNYCDYCKKLSKSPISIPLEKLVGHIQKSLKQEYCSPENAGVMIGSEGEWEDFVYNIDDMLLDIEPIQETNPDVLNDICTALYDNQYSVPFGEKEHYSLELDWSEFTQLIKHTSRFVFFHPQCHISGYSWNNYQHILDEVGEFIVKNKLIKILPQGTIIKRCRLLETRSNELLSAKDIGTIPVEKAMDENRMSPRGIPIFYGGVDTKTVIQEIFVPERAFYMLGQFIASRDMCLVDFTQEIGIPSIYDEQNSDTRQFNIFMTYFIEEISKPVQKGGSVDTLAYLPTQIIAEYIRYVLKFNNNKIDGIIYKSSISGCHNCYALFVDNEHCISPGEEQNPDELYLILTQQEHGVVSDVVPAEELRTTTAEPSEPV